MPLRAFNPSQEVHSTLPKLDAFHPQPAAGSSQSQS